jgi:hypothetical protein
MGGIDSAGTREGSSEPRSKEGSITSRITGWLFGILNTLFARDDWTTVDPDEELKEWFDTKHDNIQGIE